MAPRICFVSHAAKMEGAGRSLLETVQSLGGRGVEAHVLLPQHGPLADRLAELGVPHTTWPYAWWLGKRGESLPWRALRYAAAVASLVTALPLAMRLRRQGFDLVYSNTLASPFGAILAWLLGKPHVWHLREFVEEDHAMTFLLGRARTLRLVDRSASVCITNSQAVARAFAPPLPAHKMTTVYQAVSLPPPGQRPAPAGGPPRETLRCLLLGRMHPGKGQAIAIEAMRLLRAGGVLAELWLVGDGAQAYVAQLREAAVRAGVAEDVRFEGFTLDPLPWIAGCDLLLMCSRHEAFGRVTVEAMKMGKPVVGARSGGTTELVQDGVNGWLFEPDDAQDLADKIAMAARQRERLAPMGREAAAWADATFTEQNYADGILAQVHRALTQAQAGGA